jgi:hypothetical protein
MYAADTREAAKEASLIFAGEDRVVQYFDGDKHFGRRLAGSLGAGDLQVAWDIYLLYDEEAIWDDLMPTPMEWVHQLQSHSWADPKRLFAGSALSNRLQEILKTINT